MHEKLITQLNICRLSDIKPNFAELGREYDLDWRTVKKYYDGYSGKPSHRNKPSKLDKYIDIIEQKLSIKGVNVKAVYEFIHDEIDPDIGTYSNFNKYVKGALLCKERMKLHLINCRDYFNCFAEVSQYSRIEVGNTDSLCKAFLICSCDSSVCCKVISHGVLDTTEWGPISPQGAILGGSANEEDNGDNNCQNLNLWTPALDDGKRPVMVWLHGGGFSSGSANGGNTDGTNLALNQDVVVIGVNHRLNVYGYLDLTEYGEKYEHSDNAGLTDIVASLDWIKENVAAFGGDPENITVFGQSGGGAKVLSLMTSPYAEGKFQKGIVQSGATETLGVTFATKEQSLAITDKILTKLGITGANIEDIQTVSNADLQNAATEALAETGAEFEVPLAIGDGYGMEWGPVIDGDYMPSAPITEDGFADAGFDVPLLIGSNIDEWAMAGLRRDATDEEKALFAKAYPNEPESGADTVDTLIRLPMLKIMSHKADQGGANVYAYMFTHQEGVMGAFHGAEISYAFYNSRNARF